MVGVVGVRAASPVAPGERGREVEAESVDAEPLDPVAQRVEGHADDPGVREVQRVAAAGHVDVAPVLVEPVVRGVVEPAPRQGRAVRAGLAAVVVDDVEQNLETGFVERGDAARHLVEDGRRPLCAGGGRRVAGLRREERERVVAPVVRLPPAHERGLVPDGEHRKQLDRGHPEPGQVPDHGGVRQARPRAAQLHGDVRVPHGQAAQVRLVHDRAVPAGRGAGRGHRGRPLGAGGGHQHADTHRPGAVRVVQQPGTAATVDRLPGIVDLVSEDRLPPGGLAVDRTGVRVEEELGRVVPMTLVGCPGSVHAQAVPLARPGVRQGAVPHAVREVRQPDALLVSERVRGAGEQAHLDGVGVGREHRRACALPVRLEVHAQGPRSAAGAGRRGVGHRRSVADTPVVTVEA